MSSYREDMAAVQQQITAARQQRAQREYAEQVQALQADYRENLAARNQAATNKDREDWDYWDSLCEQNERDLQSLLPVQQPQAHPHAVRWDYVHKPYVDRLQQRWGVQGSAQKLAEADAYVTRPRNPRATNLNERGMGIQRNSPAYFNAMNNLLELYSEQITGVKFDPEEKNLTADGAAKLSGLSPRDYNQSVQALQNQGRIGRDD
jgi:hypothetical protein